MHKSRRRAGRVLAVAFATLLPVNAMALEHDLCNQLIETNKNALNDRISEWADPTKGVFSNPEPLKNRTCFASIFSKNLDLLSFSLDNILDSLGNQLCSAAFSMTNSVASSLDCGLYASGVAFGLGNYGFGGKLCSSVNVGGFGGPPVGVGMRSNSRGNTGITTHGFGNKRQADGKDTGVYSGGLFK